MIIRKFQEGSLNILFVIKAFSLVYNSCVILLKNFTYNIYDIQSLKFSSEFYKNFVKEVNNVKVYRVILRHPILI